MSTATAPISHAPPLLWAAARALITTIFNLFGEPAHIAWQHTHNQAERSLLLKWLRAGEALMRHLLLIEASHYARPNTRPLLGASKLTTRARTRRRVCFTADKPEDWRVSFRCFMDRRRPAGGYGRKRNSAAGEDAGAPYQLDPRDRWHQDRWPSPKFHSAWPLAERAEAMLRAFNNPEPYAKRLAARLHATPHRAASLTRHPENLPHVIDDFDTLRENADHARRRFESSS